MKMKPIKFSQYTTPEGVEKPCVILHYGASEYGELKTFTRTKPREKRGRDIIALFWIPDGSEINGESLTREQKAELERGWRFFATREGFLFGAWLELRKTGEVLTASIPCARLS